MASPLLEIKPKPDWAQYTALWTRSRPSLIFDLSGDSPLGVGTRDGGPSTVIGAGPRETLHGGGSIQHTSRLEAMTCWRPPRPGLGAKLSKLRLACSQKS
jgi:hypothetical protein